MIIITLLPIVISGLFCLFYIFHVSLIPTTIKLLNPSIQTLLVIVIEQRLNVNSFNSPSRFPVFILDPMEVHPVVYNIIVGQGQPGAKRTTIKFSYCPRISLDFDVLFRLLLDFDFFFHVEQFSFFSRSCCYSNFLFATNDLIRVLRLFIQISRLGKSS